jgi:MoaA/NifB/PqqE/SkfB family radical SAM enzyme
MASETTAGPGASASSEVRTKICMLPFTSPSHEPDGSIRLCSASSIFRFPPSDSNMGNARDQGLANVWGGQKYRAVREGLLKGGDQMAPFCAGCEYRHDGPAWMLQLHVALHAWHNGVQTAGIAAALLSQMSRYVEYVDLAAKLGIGHYPEVTRQTGGDGAATTPNEVIETAESPEPTPPPAGDRATAIPDELIEAAGLPIYLDLNTLNRCNVSCVMCPPSLDVEARGGKGYAYYRLTSDEYDRLSANLNVKTAHFVGAYAEPLLNKDIFEMVKTAHDRGAFTAITTNAMPLSASFSQRLIEAGLDMMTISLHGATAATAEGIMRRSNFRRVVSNIRDMQTAKRRSGTAKPEIYFNYVAQQSNLEEIPAFVALAAALEVKIVYVIHLIDGGIGVDKSTNPIHFPDVLRRVLLNAVAKAKELDVDLRISPAYYGVMNHDGAG